MNFKEHLYTFMDKEEANKLIESLNNDSFNSFRLNLLKNDHLPLDLNKVALEPLKHINNAYYFNKEDNIGKNIYFNSGAYYIQEASSMLVETFLNIKPGEKVLDMCAAPGGKSFNALLDLNNQGFLVCNDINPLRAKILSSNIEKYGFENAIVLNENPSMLTKTFRNYFDKIILDAPCSGSGMFRKDEFSIKDWSIEKVLECKKIQQNLIEEAYEMLKGKGYMTYSTCSYSIEENEEIIKEFINNHKDMKLIKIKLNEEYNKTIGIEEGIRFYPYNYKGEGQCVFLLYKDCETLNANLPTIRNKNKVDKLVINFLNEMNIDFKEENVIKIKDQYYLVNFEKIDCTYLNVLRYGIHLGYIENGRFIFSHSLAMTKLIKDNKKIELSLNEAIDYYKGYTLKTNIKKDNGIYVVYYQGYNLGFVKKVNDQLKNHLPKGLRVNIK